MIQRVVWMWAAVVGLCLADEPHVYREVRVIRVSDGDTYTLEVNVGFDVLCLVKCRLAHCDTAELHGDKGKAEEARVYVAQLLSGGIRELQVTRREKWGRWLVSIKVLVDEREVDLAEHLIATGRARPYEGGKKEPEPVELPQG